MRQFKIRNFFTPGDLPKYDIEPKYDDVYVPDNRAMDKLLKVGDDVLPNTLDLLKNPLYATALNDFAKQYQNNGYNFDGMSDEEIFNSVNADRDINNAFWSFVDNAKEYQLQRKSN